MFSAFYSFIVLAIIGLTPLSAMAYLDPGTGSFILQVVLASLLSVSFLSKTLMRNVQDGFRRVFSKTERNSGKVTTANEDTQKSEHAD